MDVFQHLNLLERNERNVGIFKTLPEFISTDDVVLDAGSGTGIMSMLCLKHGAKKVFAVEIGSIIEIARELAARNGYGNQIEFIHDDLMNIDNPELFDQITGIVAFVYMNDPRRDEARHQLVYRILELYGKKSIKLYPNQVRYSAKPILTYQFDYDTRIAQLMEKKERVEQIYGFDFSLFNESMNESIDVSFYPKRGFSGYYDFDHLVLGPNKQWHEIQYLEGYKEYPKNISIDVNNNQIPNAVIWTQELMFNNSTVFRNESISYISRKSLSISNNELILELNEDWRKSNVFKGFGDYKLL